MKYVGVDGTNSVVAVERLITSQHGHRVWAPTTGWTFDEAGRRCRRRQASDCLNLALLRSIRIVVGADSPMRGRRQSRWGTLANIEVGKTLLRSLGHNMEDVV